MGCQIRFPAKCVCIGKTLKMKVKEVNFSVLENEYIKQFQFCPFNDNLH